MSLILAPRDGASKSQRARLFQTEHVGIRSEYLAAHRRTQGFERSARSSIASIRTSAGRPLA
jgi:hypothetical protein